MDLSKRTCGSCTLCCKLLGVAELDKEKGKWCARCAIGTGCTIYEDRPKSCKDFACMWLQYEEMPEGWRPDKVKLFIWEPNHSKFNQFQVNVDDKVDWKSKPIATFINRISKLKPVVVIQGDYRTIITERNHD